MATSSAAPAPERFSWLFLANVIVVAAASLLLVLAYPLVFERLGIGTLENGFFVRLAGGFLFGEAVASYLAWRNPNGNGDLVRVIIAMKVIFIVLVVAAAASNSLPSQAFLLAALIDLAFSIAFVFYLRSKASA